MSRPDPGAGAGLIMALVAVFVVVPSVVGCIVLLNKALHSITP